MNVKQVIGNNDPRVGNWQWQEFAILEQLKNNRPHFVSTLSTKLDIPYASLRRSVQRLRKRGYNITIADGMVRFW